MAFIVGDCAEWYYYEENRWIRGVIIAVVSSAAGYYRIQFPVGELPDQTVVYVAGPDLLRPCVLPAEGEIVGIDYPPSAIPGETISIDAAVRNVGEGSGRFVLETYVNNVLYNRSPEFVVAPGATGPDAVPATAAPSTGTSMSVTLKCIRIM